MEIDVATILLEFVQILVLFFGISYVTLLLIAGIFELVPKIIGE